MEQIHGHEVIQMMLRSGQAYTRSSLLTQIVASFGPEARFYTCSAQNLSPDGIIDLLQAKGKFTPCDEGFQIDPDRMCQH